MHLLLGDSLEVLKTIEDNSVDALVTDPPAGISFMGKSWDNDKGGRDHWIEWLSQVMRECLRVMKPGAHGLVWSLPRTSHWTATALEDAGFEVRDCITHLFGSGFPKSLDISKAIDKESGIIRPLVPQQRVDGTARKSENPGKTCWKNTSARVGQTPICKESTNAAKQWQGWGTALKPACEMWWLVRKPLAEKTVAANVLKHGVAGINIDGCRVATAYARPAREPAKRTGNTYGKGLEGSKAIENTTQGRFPANLVLSHSPYCTDEQCDFECAVKMLDEQSGERKSAGNYSDIKNAKEGGNGMFAGGRCSNAYANEGGGASRFFYCAKVSPSERNAGLDRFYRVQLDCSTWNVADMEAGQLLLKAILESIPNLSIVVSGDLITVISPKDSLSTIKTEISKIIELKTWNWLMRSLTNDCTPDANLKMAHGGSGAACAKNLKELMTIIGTLPGKDGSLLVDAVPAILKSLQQISEEGAWKPLSNGHPTIKSSKLMRYLCRLITPPNGTILDCFMGSGSTGLAAKSEGFNFIGIEKEKEYFEIAKARCKIL